MNPVDEFQSQHLFVIVGGSPLPNYVAVQLLRKSTGHVYLVHTASVTKIADRICQVAKLVLGKDATKILVDDTDANGMAMKVAGFAQNKSGVGLNYTGGTKHMVIHTFRGIVVGLGASGARPTLSYLDANSLSLRIESGSANTRTVPVSLDVAVSFNELLTLHNMGVQQIETRLLCPDIYPDLPRVPYESISEWWKSASHGMSGRLDRIALPADAAFDPIRPHWLGAQTVGELAVAWDAPVGDIAKWFQEAGLESYVLWSARKVKDSAQIHESAKNFKPKEVNFEFDVVALRGYQLFAISCANHSEKAVVKQKLMEAFVRARQMGGEEARTAVVCRIGSTDPQSNPKLIEQEMTELLDAEGKIRVFGAEQLPNLSEHLLKWFTAKK